MRKTLLFIFLLIFSSFYEGAFSVEIPENNIVQSRTRKILLIGRFGDRTTKSVLPEKDPVEAFIENNKITIYFNLPCKDETVMVSVCDENSQIIVQETYTLDTPDFVVLHVDRVVEDVYTIEISGKNGYLKGEF